MGKNDKYGPRTDLSSLLQQTPIPMSQQPPEPSSLPASVMTDSEYLQQLSAILERMERLEAFVESQEERKQAFDGLYAKHIKSLSDMTTILVMNRDFLLDIKDYLVNVMGKLKALEESGIDLSGESVVALNGVSKSITDRLDDYLPDKLNELTDDKNKAIKTSATNLKDATDNIRSLKWAIIISVIWGLIGSLFAVGTFLFK